VRVAYARVSTEDQSLALQQDALAKAGYDVIFEDHGVSGVATDRPGLSKALQSLNKGDMLIVWRLDRLARSLRELTDIVWALHHRGIGFQSLCEHIDVSSAFGELTLHVLGAVAQFERSLMVERTRAGMQAAKDRGVQFGRKAALEMRQGMRVEDVAEHMGVGRSTMYRYVAEVKASRAWRMEEEAA